MKCKNCGTELWAGQSICPNCGTRTVPEAQGFQRPGDLPGTPAGAPAPKTPPAQTPQRKKRSRKGGVWVAVIAGVLAASGIAVAVGGLLAGQEKEVAAPPVLLSGSFTDRAITDQASALAAIGDAADTLGIQDVNAELTDCKEDTVSGNTYYRFQQTYQGIPVYGRSVVVAVDESGNSLSLSGNYMATNGNIHTTPTITQQDTEQAIHQYFSEQFNISEFDDISIEKTSENALCVYNMGGSNCLAYRLKVVLPPIGCYEVIVDAQKPDVLCANSLIRYDYRYDDNGQMETVSANGQKATQVFDVYSQDGVYYMADTNRNIELYQLENKKKYYWSWAYLWFANKTVYTGNTFEISWDNTEQPTEYRAEVDALANIQRTYDYYTHELAHKSTDGYGMSTIYLYTNATILDEESQDDLTNNAASGSDIENNVTQICIGRAKSGQNALSGDLDAMAHEYTHAVVKFACGLDGTDEADAINEGYSDIFGELVEKWETGSCNWIQGRRTIYNPSVNGYAKTVSDTNNGGEDFAHGHSTVISHAAYLMSTGVTDASNLQALTAEDIAHLFYETLYTLPVDCTFSQFRSLTQNMAQIMCKQGRLTPEQVQCVSAAFFEVGIAPATILTTKNLDLDVYGADGQLYENYTLYVRHHGGAENKYAGETVAAKGITFPTTGEYELVIEDNINFHNRTSVTVQVTDRGGINQMPVYTECGIPFVDTTLEPIVEPTPEPMPTPPTVSFEWFEQQEHDGWQEYAVITARDAGGNTVWSVTTPGYDITELQRVQEIGTFGDLFIYNESGTITAIDVRTGELRWENDQFGGAQISFTSDENAIYLCGYYGPSFYAIAYAGNTLARIEEFDDGCHWASEIELKDGYVCVRLAPDDPGAPDHVHYVDPVTYEVLPSEGQTGGEQNRETVANLTQLLNQFFAGFAWDNEDISAGIVTDCSFIDDSTVRFDLRVQTKSAHSPDQANILVGTVVIDIRTLKGYIEWNGGDRLPIDLSGSSYVESYMDTLRQYPEYEETSWGKEYTEYTLYDINKDAVPELIVKVANAWRYDVYTYDGQKSTLCGEMSYSLLGNISDLYEYDGNGIMIHTGGMGSERVESIIATQLINGKLNEEKCIASTENMSFDELYSIIETYTWINDFHRISDHTPFN